MSKRTLKRRLNQYGLKRRSSNITDVALQQIIETELDGSSAHKGYRGIWSVLKWSYGIMVQWDTVMNVLRELDPHGYRTEKSALFEQEVL